MTDTKDLQYKLNFSGAGSEFFSIMIVNWLLTIVTLGIYYPWARVKRFKYLYGSMALNDDRFSFHGKGKEMFIGLIKVFAIVLILSGIMVVFTFLRLQIVGALISYLFSLLVVPLAIHGSFRYRMSRTSFRGIRFGYRGNRKELTLNFIKWSFLSFITLGIYGYWMKIHIREYTLGHMRYGDVQAQYRGDGGEFFLLNLKGILLTLITLGIYSFWWQKELFEYYFGNIRFAKDEDNCLYLHSRATGGGFFKLIMINFLLVVFTLGLGTAWAEMRTMRFMADNIALSGNLDLDTIQQTEEEYTNAMGDNLLDFFDMDLF